MKKLFLGLMLVVAMALSGCGGGKTDEVTAACRNMMLAEQTEVVPFSVKYVAIDGELWRCP